MKQHRRILSLALALCLGISTIPAHAATVTTKEFDSDGNVIREWAIDTETGTATPVESPAPEESTPPVEVEPGTDTAVSIPTGGTDGTTPTESPTEPSEPTPPAETTDPNGPVVFTDVPADAWYAEAVNALAEGGLVKGVGDGKFNPDGEVTYGELVAVLCRLYCPPTAPLNANYNPVPSDNPGIVGWGSAYGWRIVTVRRIGDTSKDVENGTNGPAAHWAALYNDYLTGRTMDIVETEDLDVPAIRGSAIVHIAYAALYAKAGAPEYVNAYTPADIPDWNDVLGIEHKVFDAYSNKTADLHVWPIDDELHFLSNDYVCHDYDSRNSPGYDMDSVAANDMNGQTWVKAHPDLMLRAYNMGITEGVDETHACDVYGHLTRAELCAMLYRTGLTKPGSCDWPKNVRSCARYYDGKYARDHDAPYWK